MDPMVIVGMIVGIGFIVLGQVMEGGHPGGLIQLTAALIVYGGCFGAILVEFPWLKFVEALKGCMIVFKKRADHTTHYIEKIVEFAGIVRKQGILALEPKLQEIEDPFFKKGMQLLIDGTEPRVMRDVLETELIYHEEHADLGPKMFESAGGYLPTFGIIGAVLGLIHVMENLDDPSKIGGGIAVAFVATVYGLMGANLILLPIAKKAKLINGLHGIDCQLVIEGLMSISAGENPRLIQEKLVGFLTSAQKKKLEGGGKEGEKAAEKK
jgi:chemotaxis protein MotA